jgi:LacI family transcriptional regulator
MATLRDVAKLAGVSLSTASRVVNGYCNVREETRQRILAVIRDLNYTYEYREHSRKNITIGVLVSKETGVNIYHHPTVHTVTMGIVQQCNDEKVMNSMVLFDCEKPDHDMLFAQGISAYILVGTSQKEEDMVIPLLRAHAIPFVVVNRWLAHRHISYVNVDDYNAIREATLHMIDQGHLSLGFANGRKEMRNSAQRLDGFYAACKQKGIDIHEEWIFHGNYDENNGHEAAMRIADMAARPELMMTSSDIIAIGLIRGLQERGIRVPEDLSVVGFGDVPMSAYFRPALTTIRMPSLQLGIEAVKAVVRLMETPVIHHIKLAMDCELIERDSTRRFG